MERKIKKLEDEIIFLKRELESQNLALTRVEQAIEGGTFPETTGTSFSSSNVILELTAFRELIDKHQDILKKNTIALVGLNDILEQLRDHLQDSIADIRLDQQDHLQHFQKMLSGSMESTRAEFLMVMRDFREKYPKLEEIDHPENAKKMKTTLSKLDLEEFWTEEQKNDLDLRSEHMEQLVENYIQDSYSSIVNLLTRLLTKAEHLVFLVKDGEIDKVEVQE